MPIFDDFEFTGELERSFSGIGKTRFSADLEGAAESSGGGRGAGSGVGVAAFAAAGRVFGAAASARIGSGQRDAARFGGAVSRRIGESKRDPSAFGRRIAETIGGHRRSAEQWGRAAARAFIASAGIVGGASGAATGRLPTGQLISVSGGRALVVPGGGVDSSVEIEKRRASDFEKARKEQASQQAFFNSEYDKAERERLKAESERLKKEEEIRKAYAARDKELNEQRNKEIASAYSERNSVIAQAERKRESEIDAAFAERKSLRAAENKAIADQTRREILENERLDKTRDDYAKREQARQRERVRQISGLDRGGIFGFGSGRTARTSGRQRATLSDSAYFSLPGQRSRFFGSLGRGFGSARGFGIGGIAAAGLTVYGIGQLADLSQSLIEASAQFETFERTVRATEFSAEAAGERWQRLLDIAEQTVGIDVTGLVRFNSIMRAAGIEAGRVDSVLLSVVKSVSELGRPSYVAVEAMQQFTDAITQSHLTVRDWRAIVSRVPQFLGAASVALGAGVRSVNDFRAASDALGISISEAVLRSLEQLQTTAVGLQGTYVAAVDRFNEAFFVLRASLGEGLKDAVTPIIRGITAEIQNMNDAIEGNRSFFDIVFRDANPLGRAILGREGLAGYFAGIGNYAALPVTLSVAAGSIRDESLGRILGAAGIEGRGADELAYAESLIPLLQDRIRFSEALNRLDSESEAQRRSAINQISVLNERFREAGTSAVALQEIRINIAVAGRRDLLSEIERINERISEFTKLRDASLTEVSRDRYADQIQEQTELLSARNEELAKFNLFIERSDPDVFTELTRPVSGVSGIATDESIDRALEIIESSAFREAAERLRIREQFAGDLPGLRSYVNSLVEGFQAAEEAQVRLGQGIEAQASAGEAILQSATNKLTLDESGLETSHQTLQIAQQEFRVAEARNKEAERAAEARQREIERAAEARQREQSDLLQRQRGVAISNFEELLESGVFQGQVLVDLIAELQENLDALSPLDLRDDDNIAYFNQLISAAQRYQREQQRILERRQQLQQSVLSEEADRQFEEDLRTGILDPAKERDRLTGELDRTRQEQLRLARVPVPELGAQGEADLQAALTDESTVERRLALAERQVSRNQEIASQQQDAADRAAAAADRRRESAQSALDDLNIEAFGRAIETLTIPLASVREGFLGIAETINADYRRAVVDLAKTGTEAAEAEVTRLERVRGLLRGYIGLLNRAIDAEERRRREAERALEQRQRAYRDALELEELYQDARRLGFTDAVSALEFSRLEEFEVIKDATEAAIREEERLNNERIRLAERAARQYQRIWERAYEGIAETAIDALFDTDLDFGERLTRVAQEGLKDLASFYISQQLNSSGGGSSGGTNLPGLLQSVLGGGSAAQTALSGGSSAAGVPGVDSFIPGFEVGTTGAAQAGGGSALGGLASSALTDVVLPIAIADRLVSTRETGSLVGNLLQGAYEDILRPGFSFISRLFHDPQSDRYAYRQGSNIARAFEADHPDARRNARDFADNFSQGFLSESQNALGGGDLNIIINLGENDDAIIRYTVRQRELMEQGQIEVP